MSTSFSFSCPLPLAVVSFASMLSIRSGVLATKLHGTSPFQIFPLLISSFHRFTAFSTRRLVSWVPTGACLVAIFFFYVVYSESSRLSPFLAIFVAVLFFFFSSLLLYPIDIVWVLCICLHFALVGLSFARLQALNCNDVAIAVIFALTLVL